MKFKMQFAGHDMVDEKVCIISGENVPNGFDVFCAKTWMEMSSKLSEFFGCTFAGDEWRQTYQCSTDDIVDSLSGQCYTLNVESKND